MTRNSFKTIISLSTAYLAIGQDEIWLDDDDPNLPWENVQSVETGGLHSYLGPRDIRFTASHPCGITFKWHLNLSPSRHGMVEEKPFFDPEAIGGMFERLPKDKRHLLANLLRTEVLPPLLKVIEDQQKQLDALVVGRVIINGIIAESKEPSE